eukprot:TRINITY_DN4364_c0_g1_i1.p1 TRINITY_DN4364_c0_g1~~TRINITY_DN4364_c0_g1_i1.p1  ORF type:complete len:1295 (+),score=300.99 TRINITY_DN4364_c0_g1_i1:44-3928(+)
MVDFYSNPPFDVGSYLYGRVKDESIIQAFLKKKGGKTRGNWKERWFVIFYNVVLYYKPSTGKSKIPKDEVKPQGMILIKDIDIPNLKQFEEKSYKFPCLTIPVPKQNRNYLIQMDDLLQLQAWQELLQIQHSKIKIIIDKALKSESSEKRFECNYNLMHLTKSKSTDDLETEAWKKTYFKYWHQSTSDGEENSDGRERSPNFIKYTENGSLALDSRYYASRVALKQTLEKITEPDEWYTATEYLKEKLLHYQLFIHIGPIFLKLKRPFEMIDLNPQKDSLNDPFHSIMSLINELRELKDKFKSSYPTVYSALDQVETFYKKWTCNMKLSPEACVLKPKLVVGHDIGCRLISEVASKKILGEREYDYGTHVVTSFKGLHFKRDPGAPGFEFAVDCLNKLVSGQGSAPTQLIKVDNNIFQVSTTIDGINLRTVIDECPQLLDKINAQNYSFLFILGLLTDLQDAKPDNFIVRIHADNQSLELVGVDNDMAFAQPLIASNRGTFVNVRNVIYCMPQAKAPLSSTTVQSFLELSPELVVVEWLRLLYKQNQNYELQQRGVSGNNNIFTNEELSKINLPIKLRKGTANMLYQKISSLQAILRKSPCATHLSLLEFFEPAVHIYYKMILEKSSSISESFDNIFSAPFFEELVGGEEGMDKVLCPSKSNPNKNLRDIIQSSPRDRSPFEFIDMRTQTISDTFTEFLSVVDFSRLEDEVERDILNTICVSGISFRYFMLKRSKHFTNRMLQFLLDSCDSLQEIALVQCPNVTDEGMSLFLYHKNTPRVRLYGCPQISAECVQVLSGHNVDIHHYKTSRTSASIVPSSSPSLSDAAEFLENKKLRSPSQPSLLIQQQQQQPATIRRLSSFQYFKNLEDKSPPPSPIFPRALKKSNPPIHSIQNYNQKSSDNLLSVKGASILRPHSPARVNTTKLTQMDDDDFNATSALTMNGPSSSTSPTPHSMNPLRKSSYSLAIVGKFDEDIDNVHELLRKESAGDIDTSSFFPNYHIDPDGLLTESTNPIAIPMSPHGININDRISSSTTSILSQNNRRKNSPSVVTATMKNTPTKLIHHNHHHHQQQQDISSERHSLSMSSPSFHSRISSPFSGYDSSPSTGTKLSHRAVTDDIYTSIENRTSNNDNQSSSPTAASSPKPVDTPISRNPSFRVFKALEISNVINATSPPSPPNHLSLSSSTSITAPTSPTFSRRITGLNRVMFSGPTTTNNNGSTNNDSTPSSSSNLRNTTNDKSKNWVYSASDKPLNKSTFAPLLHSNSSRHSISYRNENTLRSTTSSPSLNHLHNPT